MGWYDELDEKNKLLAGFALSVASLITAILLIYVGFVCNKKFKNTTKAVSISKKLTPSDQASIKGALTMQNEFLTSKNP